jgi:hypothetical protein
VSDPNRIAWHYFSGFFAVDLMSVLVPAIA